MEALIRIQKELKVKKERYNEFGGFAYRNAEDILKAVRPLLEGAQLITDTEIKQIGDDVYFGSTATLSLGDETAKTTSWAREEKTRPKMGPGQLSGAAESYAKKYALGGLFALDDGYDADDRTEENKHGTWTPADAPKAAAAAQQESSQATPTTGPDQQSEPQQPEPEQQPAPATPPAGKTLAPTPEQRPWVKSLWEFYLAQAKGRPMNTKGMHKMMALCMMHMQRYPGSMSDVELCKRYIKVEELIG